jgi:hypothetical protein
VQKLDRRDLSLKLLFIIQSRNDGASSAPSTVLCTLGERQRPISSLRRRRAAVMVHYLNALAESVSGAALMSKQQRALMKIAHRHSFVPLRRANFSQLAARARKGDHPRSSASLFACTCRIFNLARWAEVKVGQANFLYLRRNASRMSGFSSCTH